MNAWNEGYNAAHRGVDYRQNPYVTGGWGYREWLRGWKDAIRVMSR